jgi:VanZ family protein
VVAVAVRIRENRARRLAAVALAVSGAIAYFAAFRTGNADVDVVEAFHFVEYGALALLFDRAWSHHADARRIAFPLLAGLTTGIVDETVQWFLASRVGELHDVLLNAAAVCFGFLVALALDPPSRSILTAPRASTRRITTAALVVAAMLVAFVNAVHVGYEIRDPDVGTFRSRYTAAKLQQMGVERAESWRDGLPVSTNRFAAEDHYLTEARWHVQERNEAEAIGDTLTAWRENRILEKYFAPLLELQAVNAEYRWSEEQRARAQDAAAGAPAPGEPYVSRAHPLPIYVLK